MGWSRRQDDWRYKQAVYRQKRVHQQVKEARQKAVKPLTPQKKLLIFFGIFAIAGLEIGYNAGHRSEGAAFIGAVIGLSISCGIILLVERGGAAAVVRPHRGPTPFAQNQIATKSRKENATHQRVHATPVAPNPSAPRVKGRSKRVSQRADRLHINAMEEELEIPLTVWDVPGTRVGDAETTDPRSPREESIKEG